MLKKIKKALELVAIILFFINLAVFFFAACFADSSSNIPYVLMCISGIYMLLFILMVDERG